MLNARMNKNMIKHNNNKNKWIKKLTTVSFYERAPAISRVFETIDYYE